MADLWGAVSPSSGPFSILTVCEGNICRSPLAAQILRARLAEAGLGIEVSSAGLRAVEGAPMEPMPAEISARSGGDPSDHVGRQLTDAVATGADLVLTMTRAQRDALVRLHPRSLRSAFTLVEFERLIGAVPATAGVHEPESLRRRVRSASASRASVTLTDEDDVADPYRRDQDVNEAVGARIVLACTEIARELAR